MDEIINELLHGEKSGYDMDKVMPLVDQYFLCSYKLILARTDNTPYARLAIQHLEELKRHIELEIEFLLHPQINQN